VTINKLAFIRGLKCTDCKFLYAQYNSACADVE